MDKRQATKWENKAGFISNIWNMGVAREKIRLPLTRKAVFYFAK